MAVSINPDSTTWTIKLKHARTTVLLFASPTDPISLLKERLLAAVHESCSDKTLNSRSLPSEASEFRLAKPVDPVDLTKGWVDIEEADDEGSKKKGKGKKGDGDDTEVMKFVRDGGTLAFEWGEEREGWEVEVLTYDAVYGDE